MHRKLLLPLFVFFSTIAAAQQVYIVPQVGLNVNTYNFDETSSNISDQRFSPGVSAGVGFNIALNEMRTFIIQPEINYSLRNNRTDNIIASAGQQNPETITLNQRNTMHYIEIPLLARLDFGIDTRYYINIGPSFSYALSGKEKLESNVPAIESYNRKADFDNRFNRTDWSAVIGGGIEFPFNDGFLVVDARFAWGFKTLYKSREVQGISGEGNPTTLTVAPEGKNRIFTLSLGYGLPLN
ncbi:MAG TPA: porin family protein [Pseudosphingobacterium sp.]|nr:porin family protein [Pseudosphingobacterium sp.]